MEETDLGWGQEVTTPSLPSLLSPGQLLRVQWQLSELGVEEVVVVSKVAQGRGGEVAVGTQLEDYFVAELGQLGVAIVTANRIARILAKLY